MILAGCLVNEEIEKEFRKLGVKDSKQVLPNKREKLAEIIKEKSLTFEITLTFPDEITDKNHAGINLNKIEAIKSAEIINKINKKQTKIIVYIDCPSPNIQAWQRYLETKIENKENLILKVEHKADVNHVSCSAASILAKTTRDAEIEKIKKQVGVDFGSGYSSDIVTCKFLKEYSHKFSKDGIFRETWQTWKSVCSEKKQKKLDEF